MDKERIRHRIRAYKELLSDEQRRAAADAVFSRLEELAAFMMAENVLMYHSLPDELQTHSFLDKWAGRKRFFLPRVNGVNLDILPYDKSRLHLGSFHIEEPDGDETASVEEMEMIVVPAVAYDKKGNRMGRGKGYYDRLMENSKATKVGVAYDFQMIDEIDSEAHDVKVDIVITERRTIFTRRREEN